MFKIYLPSHWDISKQDLLILYKKLSPDNTGIWNNIQLTSNIDDCDFVLILDSCNEDIPLDKKVIFFGREPTAVRYFDYKKSNLHLSFHHEHGETWLPQCWWLSHSYDDLVNLEFKSLDKNKNLSAIDSGKKSLLNHKLRVHTIQNFKNKYPELIDVYGFINNNPLPPRSKEDGLLNYRYNLCFENCNTDFYFSEKIVDPLLCWTMPIYYGCNNISKFFPKGSFVQIDPNDSNCIEQIHEIVNSNFFEDNIDNIREARELILTQYNLLPTIYRAVNTGKVL